MPEGGIAGKWDGLIQERDDLRLTVEAMQTTIRELRKSVEDLELFSQWNDGELAYIAMSMQVGIRDAILLAEEGWNHATVGTYNSRRVGERIAELKELLNARPAVHVLSHLEKE